MIRLILAFILIHILFSCRNETTVEKEKQKLKKLSQLVVKPNTTSEVCLEYNTDNLVINTRPNDKILYVKLFHWDNLSAEHINDWEITKRDTLNEINISSTVIGLVPQGYKESVAFNKLNNGNQYCLSFETLYENGFFIFNINDNKLVVQELNK